MSKEAAGSLTSLLVQPISPILAKALLSSPSTDQSDSCAPLAMPPDAERKTITLTVGNQWSFKKIYNVIGYLKGKKNPDRHVLVGSRHDSEQGVGASAIITQLIAVFTEQTKRGWVPDRTTVFCSWGGSALGNIGSYEWGKENRVVLQSSAVAYVSLGSPVRGTETLRATASPTLLQLTSDIQRRQLLSCIRGGNCPGPNVSSLQLPGDVSFFANQLAVPTLEFAFEQTNAEEMVCASCGAPGSNHITATEMKVVKNCKHFTVDGQLLWLKWKGPFHNVHSLATSWTTLKYSMLKSVLFAYAKSNPDVSQRLNHK